MAIDLTLAGPQDLQQLLEMMREYQADDPWSCHFDERLARGAMDDLLHDPSAGRVWIIKTGADMVGYIVMSFDYSREYRGKNAWVDEFFVRPAHRGQGIGTKALEFFEDQARLLGVKAIHLGVNHGNPALELYRRRGFEGHQRYLMTKWIAEKP